MHLFVYNLFVDWEVLFYFNKVYMSKNKVSKKQEARNSAPRNSIVRAMVEKGLFQASTHKDRKKLAKNGNKKHKARIFEL